ncbi:thiamine-phosphate pyrophosphorylase [Helicobacter sp. MIT 05-5293]|nr:thiamine-phosphate pyrophosphorylase [Helicobacter sp. MIT 05-5293]
METKDNLQIGRVIDANLNRLKEGIRVIEDTLRYFHNDAPLALSLKSLRHQVKVSDSSLLLAYRDIRNDVSKRSIADELERDNIAHLVIANFKRAQESARVLEEYLKLDNTWGDTHLFKTLRYELYDLEKQYVEKYF